MSDFGMPWLSRRKRGLRGWVVMILARAPKTGAEVMDDMERMSGGWWRPSPGSVYPLLEELTKEGVTRKRDDGRYELVEPPQDHRHGWPFPVAGPRSPEDALREISSLTAYLEDLARSDPKRFEESRASAKESAERLMRLAR
jgi:hypothetical protein